MSNHDVFDAGRVHPKSTLAPSLIVALIVAMAAQVACYPEVASWAHQAATGRGWDGSALRYFQIFRVLPAAAVGMAALTGVAIWRASMNRPLGLGAIALLWVFEFSLFFLSIAWYASQVS